MVNMKKSKKLLTISFMAALLSACGGGGGDSSGDAANSGDIQTGKFNGVAVQGLYYETETLNGLTDEDGEYRYREGEFIRFKVGGTELGTAEAKDGISPFDLLGLTPPSDEADIVNLFARPMLSSFDLVINTSILLFSLDIDGNPENGIDLGTAHEDLDDVELELAVKSTEFAQQSKTKGMINRQVKRDPVAYLEATRLLYENLGIQLTVKRTTEAKTKTGSGVAQTKTSSSYSREGLLETESLQASDENPAIEISYEYDQEKRLKRTTNSFTKQVEELSYEDNRVIERVIQTETDDNTQEAKESMSYNEKGQITRLEQDLDGDGEQDVITEFNYTANREQVKVTEKVDGGEKQSLTTKTFKNGLIDQITEDYNNDGVTDVTISYSYDDRGRMSQRTIVSTEETIESGVSAFEYDDQDRVIGYTLDSNNDNQADYIEASAYDINGNQTELKRDLNADGQWDYVALYRFDDKGNRIEASEDNNGDGIVDKYWKLELQQESVESDLFSKDQ